MQPTERLQKIRIALKLEYCGKDFKGSQSQGKLRTVQSELEKALSTLLRQSIKVILSGRTDSGVHACGQVLHFDADNREPDLWRLVWGLNGILPPDLSVTCAQIVPGDFHARYSAIERHYVYRLLNRPQRSALLKDTQYFFPHYLDYERMSQVAKLFAGTHDFASFRSSNADKTVTRCIVSRSELLNLGEGQLEFWIAANHFVYNMVRIIVGTLIEVGCGERTGQDVKNALKQGDRNLAGPTAPAWGLTLASVKYPEAFNLFTDYEAVRRQDTRERKKENANF